MHTAWVCVGSAGQGMRAACVSVLQLGNFFTTLRLVEAFKEVCEACRHPHKQWPPFLCHCWPQYDAVFSLSRRKWVLC